MILDEEKIKEKVIKKDYPKHYELYSKYDKWALIAIIVAKDDVIDLHKKFKFARSGEP